LTPRLKHILVFEMNLGQMVEDVNMSVCDKATVHFHGRPGGVISTPHEIADAVTKILYRYELG